VNFSLKRCLAAALPAALLIVGVPVLAASPATASAASLTQIANNEVGHGPCDAGGVGSGVGYYASNANQNSSCIGDGHAWCADFAAWVWQQAGATVDTNLTDSAGSFVAYGNAHPGMLHGDRSYQPQVGDAVVFDYSSTYYGPNSPGADHVALVSDITQSGGTTTSLTYMNGNWGNKVTPQTESIGFYVGQQPSGEIGENGQMTVSYYVSPVGLTAIPDKPTVSVTSPGTVSGNVTISAAVSDSTSGVTYSTKFYVTPPGGSAAQVGSSQPGSAPSVMWNTTGLPGGTYTIKATSTASNASGTSPSATSAAVSAVVYNSPVAADGNGRTVVFIDPSGKVAYDLGDSSGWHGPTELASSIPRADSPVVINQAGTVIVFIDSTGRVVNDWYNSTGWHGPATTGTGTALAGSPLAINAAGNEIAFIDSSGNVALDTGTSGWTGPHELTGAPRADTPIAMNDAGTDVVYFNTSDNVVNNWADSGGAWHGPANIGGTAAAASSITDDDAGDSVVFTDSSGRVVHDYPLPNNGEWSTSPGPLGGTAPAGSGFATSGDGTDVTFFNSSSNLVHDYVSNVTHTWASSPGPLAGTARTGSGIAEDDAADTIFFVDTSGYIVNAYFSSTANSWMTARIHGTSR
jgi:hypothetical protein